MQPKISPEQFAKLLRDAAKRCRAQHQNDRAACLYLMAAALIGFADRLI